MLAMLLLLLLLPDVGVVAVTVLPLCDASWWWWCDGGNPCVIPAPRAPDPNSAAKGRVGDVMELRGEVDSEELLLLLLLTAGMRSGGGELPVGG